jgi:hypothetical protein
MWGHQPIYATTPLFSEPQFKSHRRLGESIAGLVFEKITEERVSALKDAVVLKYE